LAAFNYWQGLFTIALGKTNSELLNQTTWIDWSWLKKALR
jgi:hypothetical protein